MNPLTQQLDDFLSLIRWNKPVGSLLLLWPTLTAVWTAGAGHPHAKIIFVFLIGTFLMRAAGCIINDFADRQFDGHVERTKQRPLVAGKLSSQQALIYFGILCFAAFLLVLLLNLYAIILAIFALGFAIAYPFLKRVTHWPQLGLGIAFSFGVPMAYAAQLNHVPFEGWLLFLLSLIWTIAYDTQYAMVDREDDLKIGIKSTAILFGNADALIVGFMQVAVLGLLFLFGTFNGFNFWYFLSVLICTGLFIYQLSLTKTGEPANCLKAFINNHWAWMIIFIGVVLSYAS